MPYLRHVAVGIVSGEAGRRGIGVEYARRLCTVLDRRVHLLHWSKPGSSGVEANLIGQIGGLSFGEQIIIAFPVHLDPIGPAIHVAVGESWILGVHWIQFSALVKPGGGHGLVGIGR